MKPRIIRKMPLAAASIVFVLLSLHFVPKWLAGPYHIGDAVCVETGNWYNSLLRKSPLLFRYENDLAESFLVKLDDPGTNLFRYDVRRHAFVKASEQAWTNASGDICKLVTLLGRPGLETLRVAQNRLVTGFADSIKQVEMKGEHPEGFRLSPTGRFAVVTSSYLPSRISPSMWGSRSPLEFYHELFVVSTTRSIGDTRPQHPKVKHFDPPLWSPDERFLLYLDMQLSVLCVVPLTLEEGSK